MVVISYVRAAVSAAASAIWALSLRRWGLLSLGSSLLYLWNISTLSSRRRNSDNSPCPEHGPLLRIMYGLFSTWLAERVLGHLLHTRPDEPQAEQIGGTLPSVMGPRELRIKVVPILGAAFGGNYAYLIWDEDDPDRRAIVVDPAALSTAPLHGGTRLLTAGAALCRRTRTPCFAPQRRSGSMLRFTRTPSALPSLLLPLPPASPSCLSLTPLPHSSPSLPLALAAPQVLLTTHWHFDHSGGNATFAREARKHARARPPAPRHTLPRRSRTPYNARHTNRRVQAAHRSPSRHAYGSSVVDWLVLYWRTGFKCPASEAHRCEQPSFTADRSVNRCLA